MFQIDNFDQHVISKHNKLFNFTTVTKTNMSSVMTFDAIIPYRQLYQETKSANLKAFNNVYLSYIRALKAIQEYLYQFVFCLSFLFSLYI